MATRLLHVVPACIGAQLFCNNPTCPPKNVIQQGGGKTTTTTKEKKTNEQMNKMFKVQESSIFQTCWPDIAT